MHSTLSNDFNSAIILNKTKTLAVPTSMHAVEFADNPNLLPIQPRGLAKYV